MEDQGVTGISLGTISGLVISIGYIQMHPGNLPEKCYLCRSKLG